jgi:hypothetical protein
MRQVRDQLESRREKISTLAFIAMFAHRFVRRQYAITPSPVLLITSEIAISDSLSTVTPVQKFIALWPSRKESPAKQGSFQGGDSPSRWGFVRAVVAKFPISCQICGNRIG